MEKQVSLEVTETSTLPGLSRDTIIPVCLGIQGSSKPQKYPKTRQQVR